MPPSPPSSSMYTLPNLVFVSGIIAWIIFIITLLVMKTEKYGPLDIAEINKKTKIFSDRIKKLEKKLEDENKACKNSLDKATFFEKKIKNLEDKNKKLDVTLDKAKILQKRILALESEIRNLKDRLKKCKK